MPNMRSSHPAWDAWIEIIFSPSFTQSKSKSHPAWDAWIEIIFYRDMCNAIEGRIPHGMRGLKLMLSCPSAWLLPSHPAWDAWIEIILFIFFPLCFLPSHPAWDAWIEILLWQQMSAMQAGRIPHGMRGLKLSVSFHQSFFITSHPAWDAWIEIFVKPQLQHLNWSHPAWDAWIEIAYRS